MAGLVDQLSAAFTPHREKFEEKVGTYLQWILWELRAINKSQRPNIFDKWGSRPFTGVGSGVEIIRTHLNTALKVQTLWFQAKHKKEKEPLPAFLIQVNGIPVFALAPQRILEPEEWGVYSWVFGGDLVIPRGSIVEIVPMFTGEFEIRGTLTFTRELLENMQVPAGGTSQEEYNRLGHSAEYEPGRYVPDMPGSDFAGTEVPEVEQAAAAQREYGGVISPDTIISGSNGATEPET